MSNQTIPNADASIKNVVPSMWVIIPCSMIPTVWPYSAAPTQPVFNPETGGFDWP